MTDDDLEAFSKELLTIAEGFYEKSDKKQLPPEAVMIFFEALREHSLDDVLRALRLHVKTPQRCKFWPKPGDIEELISGSRATASLEAWTKVEAAVRRHGRYRSVVFDDALIHLVVEDMGGWPRLCEVASEKDMEFQRQEFCRRYEGARLVREFPAVLIGILDGDALRERRELSMPVLIGESTAASLVFQHGALPVARKTLRLPVEVAQKMNDHEREAGGVPLLERT